MNIVETILVPLASLKPAAYNPRTITEENRRGLAESLERFGLVQDIVVNKRTMNIVGGHQRYDVLKEKGVEFVTAKFVDLSDEDEVRLNITLNAPSIQGTFTSDQLMVLLDRLGARKERAKGEKPNYDQLVFGGIVPEPPPAPPEPPKEFKKVDSDLPTCYRCPKCAYEWAGSPQ